MLCSTQNLLTDVLDKVGDIRSVHDRLRTPTLHKGDPSTHVLLSRVTLFITITMHIGPFGLIIQK